MERGVCEEKKTAWSRDKAERGREDHAGKGAGEERTSCSLTSFS
jgi:hypothetical protein